MRVPNAGKAERERLDQIRRLEKKLAHFQSIPAHRREADCADEGEGTCRMLLAEFGAAGHERPQRARDGAAMLKALDEFLDDIEPQ